MASAMVSAPSGCDLVSMACGHFYRELPAHSKPLFKRLGITLGKGIAFSNEMLSPPGPTGS